uniref:Uncharacterized LOC114653453 n=1 Tax=Erpetoichthys calabaricus TaxID=27687 RepID=A0A8C4RW21_ERPCA
MFLLMSLIVMVRLGVGDIPSCEFFLNRRVSGVFLYDRHTRYNLTFDDAADACEKDFGATIADRHQLYAAYKAGLEECRAGWILGAEVAYPRITQNWNCGQNETGIITYGIRKNQSETWDVFCYKEDDNCTAYESIYLHTLNRTHLTDSLDESIKTKNELVQRFLAGEDLDHISEDISHSNGSYIVSPVSQHKQSPSIFTNSFVQKKDVIMPTSSIAEEDDITPKIMEIPESSSQENLNNSYKEEHKESSFDENSTKHEIPTTLSDLNSLPSRFLYVNRLFPLPNVKILKVVPPTEKSTLEDKHTHTKPESTTLSDSSYESSWKSTDQSEVTRPNLPYKLTSPTEKSLLSLLSTQHPQKHVVTTVTPIYLSLKDSTQSKYHSLNTEEPIINSTETTSVVKVKNVTLASFRRNDIDHGNLFVLKGRKENSTRSEIKISKNASFSFTPKPEQFSENGPYVENDSLIRSENLSLAFNQSTNANRTSSFLFTAREQTTLPYVSILPFTISKMITDTDYSLKTAESLKSVDISNYTEYGKSRSKDNSILHMFSHNRDVELPIISDRDKAEKNMSTSESMERHDMGFPEISFSSQEFSYLKENANLTGRDIENNNIVEEITATPHQVSTLSLDPTTPPHESSATLWVPLATWSERNGKKSMDIQTYAVDSSNLSTTNIYETKSTPSTDISPGDKSEMTALLNKFSSTPPNDIQVTETTEQWNKYKSSPITSSSSSQLIYNPTQALNLSYVAIDTSTQMNISLVSVTSHLSSSSHMLQDACGGVLSGTEGEFQSPGFPQSYLSDMECTWTIEAPLGSFITLTFHSFVLEDHKSCEYDYVTIYDGETPAGQELGRFCGSEMPAQIRTRSNYLAVVMKSDSSVELDGFSARFTTTKLHSVSTSYISLHKGGNLLEGVIELEYNGQRGGICSKGWDDKAATVACHQLGFTGPALATRIKTNNESPVIISYMKCKGHEKSLDDCENRRGSKCSTKERAAVHCQVLKSCSSLKNAGVLEPGVYLIDPDGEEFGVDPFPVHCDMDSYPEVGITVVGHNSEDRLRISPCEDAGCYSRQIVYKQASLHQLRVLTEISQTCEQFVKLECRHIRFLRENWGWWISRDGQKVQSWGGSSTNSGKCACGERGDCDLGLSTCNCDANDEVWRSDEGYLTDKSVLPVREVRFGDTRDVPVEMAFYSIGKLQCKGEKTTIPVLESCAALKVAGFTKSGRYVIDPDGPGKGVSQFEVSCDMTSDPVTGITLVSHDSETRMRVAPCESPGCYGRELKYEASLTQLNALTKVSRCCEQFVKLDCRHIRFLQSGWGWWVSWDGHKMLDWGGAEVNSSSCACGMTGTCSGPGRLCNCDSNDVIWRTDEGYLRHKSSLPIKAVHFGDTQDAPLEMAFHTVGKLTCKGRAMSDK